MFKQTFEYESIRKQIQEMFNADALNLAGSSLKNVRFQEGLEQAEHWKILNEFEMKAKEFGDWKRFNVMLCFESIL